MTGLVHRVGSYVKRVPGAHAGYARLLAAMQDRRAARTAAAYRAASERLGARVLDEPQLAGALRRRLAARGVTPRARKKGELHVFLACGVVNWERVLPLALAPYGRVSAFEWRSRGYDERAPDWVHRREAMNGEMLEAFTRADGEQPVDAFIGYLSGRNTARATLEAIGRSGAVVFNFCWDDKLNFPGPRLGGRYTSPAELAAAVDLNLTDAADSIVRYAVHGGLALFWPMAGEPTIHRPAGGPFAYDVSFVGQKYGTRPLFVAALRRRGIRVATFGDRWEHGPVSDEEMVGVYARSRINLGFAGVQYCRRLKGLKGRDFEIPLSGGLYLTEDHPGLHHVYDVGREIVTYHDVRDCAAKVRWLLGHPEEAERIRAGGRARALRDHTWEARFDRIFRLAALLEEG